MDNWEAVEVIAAEPVVVVVVVAAAAVGKAVVEVVVEVVVIFSNFPAVIDFIVWPVVDIVVDGLVEVFLCTVVPVVDGPLTVVLFVDVTLKVVKCVLSGSSEMFSEIVWTAYLFSRHFIFYIWF